MSDAEKRDSFLTISANAVKLGIFVHFDGLDSRKKATSASVQPPK